MILKVTYTGNDIDFLEDIKKGRLKVFSEMAAK